MIVQWKIFFYNLQGHLTDNAQKDLWFILPARSKLKAFHHSQLFTSSISSCIWEMCIFFSDLVPNNNNFTQISMPHEENLLTFASLLLQHNVLTLLLLIH